MTHSLFRPEALEHRRDAGFGVVVRRHRWRVGVPLALSGLCLLGLIAWLMYAQALPDRSLFEWVIARVAGSSHTAP